jgi:hypothetical protein
MAAALLFICPQCQTHRYIYIFLYVQCRFFLCRCFIFVMCPQCHEVPLYKCASIYRTAAHVAVYIGYRCMQVKNKKPALKKEGKKTCTEQWGPPARSRGWCTLRDSLRGSDAADPRAAAIKAAIRAAVESLFKAPLSYSLRCEDVCWRVLTYADVCWRMLTYADVCWLSVMWGRDAADPRAAVDSNNFLSGSHFILGGSHFVLFQTAVYLQREHFCSERGGGMGLELQSWLKRRWELQSLAAAYMQRGHLLSICICWRTLTYADVCSESTCRLYAYRHVHSLHTSAYVSIRQHTSAYVSIRQHMHIDKYSRCI